VSVLSHRLSKSCSLDVIPVGVFSRNSAGFTYEEGETSNSNRPFRRANNICRLLVRVSILVRSSNQKSQVRFDIVSSL
jgi:hypothetical protein